MRIDYLSYTRTYSKLAGILNAHVIAFLRKALSPAAVEVWSYTVVTALLIIPTEMVRADNAYQILKEELGVAWSFESPSESHVFGFAHTGDQAGLQSTGIILEAHNYTIEALLNEDDRAAIASIDKILALWRVWKTKARVIPKEYPGDHELPTFIGWVTQGESKVTGQNTFLDYYLNDAYFFRELIVFSGLLHKAAETFTDQAARLHESADDIDRFFIENIWSKWNGRGCSVGDRKLKEGFLIGAVTHMDSHWVHSAVELLSRDSESKIRIGLTSIEAELIELVDLYLLKLKQNISSASDSNGLSSIVWEWNWLSPAMFPTTGTFAHGGYSKNCIVFPPQSQFVQDTAHGNQVVRALSAISKSGKPFNWNGNDLLALVKVFNTSIYRETSNPRFAEYIDGTTNPPNPPYGLRHSQGWVSGWAELASVKTGEAHSPIDPEQSKLFYYILSTYISTLRNSTTFHQASYIRHPAGLIASLAKTASLLKISCDQIASMPGSASLAYFSSGKQCPPTPQCSDNQDNDNDGVKDKDDPGCWGNPNDPGSYNPGDNNEGDGTTRCQDGIDNDNDNAADMEDPGCSSPTDNDESNEPSLLTVGIECITENKDKSKTAYFSYNNTTAADMTVSTDATEGTLNKFVSNDSSVKPPTSFKAGQSKGTVVATFSGDSLTWVVRAPKSALSQATANASSPRCAAVVPMAECRGFSAGVMKVRLGYTNPNTFEQQIAVGVNNGFTPGTVNRGQPSRFFAGTNKSVVDVALDSSDQVVTWNINDSKITLDGNLPTCDGQCTDVPTGAITGNLDRIASELSAVMNRAAEALALAKANLSVEQRVRNRRDAERSKRKAERYEALAKSITINFPTVVKTCPQAPEFWSTVDRGIALDSLRHLYANQRNSTMRTVARAHWRNLNRTRRDDRLVKQAKALEAQGITELLKLPRVVVACK